MAGSVTQVALKTIALEAASISGLAEYINADFEKAVQTIAQCKGRIVVSGIGKSAIIAQKIVATFNSTGTPSIFLHAADAIHGDLGMVQQEDVVIIISKSGESPEIKVLVPLIRNFKNPIIAIVGNTGSYLAKNANIILNTTVEQEACPNNLAPTTSTTVQLALGDALAVSLLKCRNFTATDFAKFHPGGALGKKLYLKVKDIYPLNAAPQVQLNSSIKDVIIEITQKRLGATAVMAENKLAGLITDGDIRRMLEAGKYRENLTAGEIMNASPRTIDEEEMAVDALSIMRENKISQIVITKNNTYAGMVHIHDLNREGII